MRLRTFFSIFALLSLSASVFSAQHPVTDTTGNAYEFGMLGASESGVISSTTRFDSLQGSADSVILIRDWMPKSGWEYFLNIGPITDKSGNPDDTLDADIWVYFKDFNGAVTYRKLADTLGRTDTTGLNVLLPIGSYGAAHAYDIVIKSSTAQDTTHINQVYIGRRK